MDQFEASLLAQRPMLTRYAMKLYKHAEDAEDAVQETFMRALAARDRFDPATNIAAWLSTIMLNITRMKWKKGNRIEFTDDPHYHAQLVAPGNPERAIIVRQGFQAVMRLSGSHFDAVWGVGQGYSYDEMAAQAGVPAGTIKSRLSRARDHLEYMTGGIN